jgi:hypothetical protein
MKLVLLMYLEDDEKCVDRLLGEQGVDAFSRVSLEGRGQGGKGWRGSVAAYRSQMVIAVVPEEMATRLVQAVEECRGIVDPAHPIRAVVVAVERVAACLCGE